MANLLRSPLAKAAIVFGFCLAPQVARGGVNRWTTAGPFLGQVNALVSDPTNPSLVYAATSGNGVFRSSDGGASWTAANLGLIDGFVLSLAIDPTHPVTLYAGTQQSLFQTVNGGDSWESRSGDGLMSGVTSLAIDPANPSTIYAATTHGVFKSSDAACSWVDSSNGLVPYDYFVAIALDPSDSQTLYLGALFRQAYKSTDAGANWTPTSGGLIYPAVNSFAIDPTNSQTLYAATSFFSEADGSQGGAVFKSYDGGSTWFALSNSLPNVAFRTVRIDPNDPAIAYASGPDGGVFRTSNAGVTWSPRNSGLIDLNAGPVITTGTPTTLFVGTAGGVFRSDDGASNWSAGGSGFTAFQAQTLALASSPDGTLWTGGRNWAVAAAKSVDAGLHWSASAVGLPTRSNVLSLASDATSPSVVYAGLDGFAGVYKSIDGGATWLPTGNLLGDRNTDATVVRIDPFTPSTAYAGSLDGVYRSDDGGATWTNASGYLPYVLALVADDATPGVLFASINGAVEKSTDFGDTWNPSNTGIESAIVYSLAQSPADPMLLLAGAISAIYRSTDGGASWVPSSGIPDSSYVPGITFDPSNTQIVYAAVPVGTLAPSAGLYRSTDGGANWTPFDTGLSAGGKLSEVTFAVAVSPDGNTLHTATGSGVFEMSLSAAAPPTITGLDPISGPSAGGTTITISGQDFDAGVSVMIGVVPGQVVQASSGQIVATTPAGTPGRRPLTVTNSDTQFQTQARGFVYDFLDVLPSVPYHDAVVHAAWFGITAGCGGGNFCPDVPLTRAQTAVLFEKAIRGAEFQFGPSGSYLTDVDRCSPTAPYIYYFLSDGLSSGCGFNLFCPDSPVTRAQMAVFLLRGEHGASYVPPPATGTVFGDVHQGDFAADFIEQLAIEGITAGCGGGNFCPMGSTTRAQSAVFLDRTLLIP